MSKELSTGVNFENDKIKISFVLGEIILEMVGNF